MPSRSLQIPSSMPELLGFLSDISTFVILVLFTVHLVAFIALWIWWRRDLRAIASWLDDFTRGLKHRSVLGHDGHLTDQIDAFLADVNDVLETGSSEGRLVLFHRMNVLDEKRRYLKSMSFETCFNVCRTMIEAYPIMGILGTVLAIGSALQAGSGVAGIVSRFGEAIWSTFAGLLAAVLLMLINSILEPRFTRLAENRAAVRDTVGRTKRELAVRTEAPS